MKKENVCVFNGFCCLLVTFPNTWAFLFSFSYSFEYKSQTIYLLVSFLYLMVFIKRHELVWISWLQVAKSFQFWMRLSSERYIKTIEQLYSHKSKGGNYAFLPTLQVFPLFSIFEYHSQTLIETNSFKHPHSQKHKARLL